MHWNDFIDALQPIYRRLFFGYGIPPDTSRPQESFSQAITTLEADTSHSVDMAADYVSRSLELPSDLDSTLGYFLCQRVEFALRTVSSMSAGIGGSSDPSPIILPALTQEEIIHWLLVDVWRDSGRNRWSYSMTRHEQIADQAGEDFSHGKN